MADIRFFSKSGPYSLADLAQFCQANLQACQDPHEKIDDVRPLAMATSQDLACYHNTKYISDLINTQARACLIHPDHVHQAPERLALLVTERPYRAYAQLLGRFYPESAKPSLLAPTARIAKTAKIAPHCHIADYVIIGEHVEIGEGCHISAHTVIEDGVILGQYCHVGSSVSISHAIIGNHATIKTGARIGQKGFGFDMDDKGHVTVPQLGRVMIGNHVEIGANTTIDRGSNGDTQIGNGCRIDNLVQIAHNVVLGDHCILVAQVGIAGSTKLGKFVVAAGQVGIAGHLTIGDGVRIAAKSGLMRDVTAGETVAGIPAIPVREHFRQVALLSKMTKKKS